MFGTLGNIAARRPWLVIAAWIVVTVGVVATAPALQSTQDQSEFLPDHYESARAQDITEKAFPRPEGVTAQIDFCKTDKGKLELYVSYLLENCMISSLSVNSGGDRPQESLTLNFTKIESRITPMNSDGSARSRIRRWTLSASTLVYRPGRTSR